MDTLSAASTSFALSLFTKLSENASTKNVFFSPFSISSALSMVFLGTKGNTAAQMKQVCLEELETLNKCLYLNLSSRSSVCFVLA